VCLTNENLLFSHDIVLSAKKQVGGVDIDFTGKKISRKSLFGLFRKKTFVVVVFSLLMIPHRKIDFEQNWFEEQVSKKN